MCVHTCTYNIIYTTYLLAEFGKENKFKLGDTDSKFRSAGKQLCVLKC